MRDLVPSNAIRDIFLRQITVALPRPPGVEADALDAPRDLPFVVNSPAVAARESLSCGWGATA